MEVHFAYIGAGATGFKRIKGIMYWTFSENWRNFFIFF